MLDERQDLNVLISVLARTYEQFFLIEKSEQNGRFINDHGSFECVPYDTWCRDVCAKDYIGDDEKNFLKKVSKDAVTEALRYEDEYVVRYSCMENEQKQCKVFKAFGCLGGDILCLTLSDVTREEAMLEDASGFAQKCLEIANECNTAKERFFAAAEQELRGPIYSIQGILDKALETEAAVSESCIRDAQLCLKEYSDKLEKLLMKTRMEKGGIAPQDDVILTESFCQRLYSLGETKALEKGICFELKNLSPASVAFESDQRLLEMLLGGLLDVCMNYSANGAEVLSEMLLDFREATEEDVEVFDFVFRVKSSGLDMETLSEKEKNILVFLQYVTDSLEGVLQFEHCEETAKVSLRIPIRPVDEETAREKGIAVHMTDSIRERDFSRYRVLVVDDDTYRRRVTAAKLERFGLAVDVAGDGQEAIDMLVAAPMRYYHMMFINPMLPVKTGYEVTMELREMSRIDINDITIVALTTNPLRDDRIKALEHGMDYHIQIPFDDIEMKEILIRELQDIGPDESPEVFGFRVIK